MYDGWLARLDMTYMSVANCCEYALRDRSLAEKAALRVIAGLVARPRVFGYYGLPYSGRVAHLTEEALAEARAGAVPPPTTWSQLRAALGALDPADQRVFASACVDGIADDALAASLGCSEEGARTRKAEAIGRLQQLCQKTLPAWRGSEA